MMLETTLRYLGIWSGIGCALFCGYVVLLFRTGLVYTARKQDGTLKEKIPFTGYLNASALLLGVVGLQVAANHLGLGRKALELGFVPLLLLNYGHYLVLFLFDTIVIDGLVLGVWRPAFLEIPPSMGAESMRRHIAASLPVGLAAGIVLAAMATVISHLAFFVG